MKKNAFIALAIIILVGLTIGGKWYMEREKDKQELLTIQTDLANYLYNNYVLYTSDESKVAEIDKEFDNGRNGWTNIEYLEKLKNARIYSDIKKIEFTKISTTSMNAVNLNFVINSVYTDDVSLDTVSAETGKLIYHIGEYNGDGPYYLEKKKRKTNDIFPEKSVVFYKGGIE
ncbi:hypothetical protein [Enterococcus sp. UD-01]|jgi:hypothetical protein|uniref:hypothetical protein n=1 Tax=Enterococcus sp. UD-01 TaxID=3373911 RepID=UPI003837A5D5